LLLGQSGLSGPLSCLWEFWFRFSLNYFALHTLLSTSQTSSVPFSILSSRSHQLRIVAAFGSKTAIIVNVLTTQHFFESMLCHFLQDDDSLRRASAVPGAPPTASVAATTTAPVPAASAATGVCSHTRPNSSPRRSPKWPCSLDLPETNSRGSGGRSQLPLPAGPGSHAGEADVEERSARRVTFSDSEQAGPADHEPQHGPAGSTNHHNVQPSPPPAPPSYQGPLPFLYVSHIIAPVPNYPCPRLSAIMRRSHGEASTCWCG
jgi:hypothetical protein